MLPTGTWPVGPVGGSTSVGGAMFAKREPIGVAQCALARNAGVPGRAHDVGGVVARLWYDIARTAR